MMIVEMLVTVLAFWVGTAMDPGFWLLAIIIGSIIGRSRDLGWLRIVFAVLYGLVRCVIMPWMVGGYVRADFALVAAAVAIEFWAVMWIVAHAPLWFNTWRAKRNARRSAAGVGG